MIRKEIKEDNTFGGNYPFDIDYTNLPSRLIEITEEQRDYIDANLEKLKYINGIIQDISQTPEYIAEQRLKQIDIELQQAEQDYITAIDTPIKYYNNKKYKPKWAEQTYINLISAGNVVENLFPKKIWDATELEINALEFTLEDLVNLTQFLALELDKLFQIKKTTINNLLIEKENILKELEDNNI